jgi:hypothetical protein
MLHRPSQLAHIYRRVPSITPAPQGNPQEICNRSQYFVIKISKVLEYLAVLQAKTGSSQSADRLWVDQSWRPWCIQLFCVHLDASVLQPCLVETCLGGGSGYSTLFTKHMACGCLPFAQSFMSTKQLMTHTIVVSKDPKLFFQNDLPIEKRNIEELHLPLGAKYLDSLPRVALFNKFYFDCYNNAIYDNFKLDHQMLWPWSRAVAGIAFGGLVPVAADYLVRAVTFTVGGNLLHDYELQNSSSSWVKFKIMQMARWQRANMLPRYMSTFWQGPGRSGFFDYEGRGIGQLQDMSY